jgi:hypothetical protein
MGRANGRADWGSGGCGREVGRKGRGEESDEKESGMVKEDR